MDILIVEDDALIQDMLTDFLEDEGYQTARAANGLEALTHLRKEIILPCLILLDLNMPIMTGWQFRHHQQQDPVLASIPTVIVSALRNLKNDLLSPAPAGLLEKPVDFDKLLSTVEQYCNPR
jgi:CheY-like chemotaxis protein